MKNALFWNITLISQDAPSWQRWVMSRRAAIYLSKKLWREMRKKPLYVYTGDVLRNKSMILSSFCEVGVFCDCFLCEYMRLNIDRKHVLYKNKRNPCHAYGCPLYEVYGKGCVSLCWNESPHAFARLVEGLK